VDVNARAAPVDLAGAHLDEVERRFGHSGPLDGFVQRLQRFHRLGKDHHRMIHTWMMHKDSPVTFVVLDSSV
jgi:hypothetical protein